MGKKWEVRKRVGKRELVEVLEELLSCAKRGELSLENLRLPLPEELDMELEYKEKRGRCRFELELEWYREARAMAIGDEPTLAVRLGEEVYIYSALCPHRGARLEFDEERGKIVCREHGAEFDPRTGKPLRGPAKEPLKRIF